MWLVFGPNSTEQSRDIWASPYSANGHDQPSCSICSSTQCTDACQSVRAAACRSSALSREETSRESRSATPLHQLINVPDATIACYTMRVDKGGLPTRSKKSSDTVLNAVCPETPCSLCAGCNHSSLKPHHGEHNTRCRFALADCATRSCVHGPESARHGKHSQTSTWCSVIGQHTQPGGWPKEASHRGRVGKCHS